jgi:large subunit ribosomal protein L33
MPETVYLECSVCKRRNYRVKRDTRGTERLEIKKYCASCRAHQVHIEKRR